MNKDTIKENLFLTAFPTMPIQDNYGQIIMQAGMSKLEYAATIMAAHICTTPAGQQVEPESIAQESVSLAKAVLSECQREFDNMIKPKIV